MELRSEDRIEVREGTRGRRTMDSRAERIYVASGQTAAAGKINGFTKSIALMRGESGEERGLSIDERSGGRGERAERSSVTHMIAAFFHARM